MKTKSKRTLTPTLRFPEFRNKPGWDVNELGQVATFHKGNGLPKSALTFDGTEKCIHYGQLFTEYPEVIDSIISRTDIDTKGIRSSSNDVLMPTSDVTPNGLAKACCVKIDNVILGGDILAIRSSLNGEFLAREIRHLERKVLQLVSGSTVFHLYPSSLEKLSVPFPTHAEQQKIADCLGSLDGLIAAEGRKLAALRDHKRGLMQQLLPQPGQNQPRLRFSYEGNWTVDSLPELAFFQEGPGIMAVDFRTEGVPLVRLAGVGGSVVTLDGCNYLDPAKVAQKWSHFRLEVNDIIISTSATFGLSSIVTDSAAGAVFYTGLIRFRPSNERVDLGYLKIFLESSHFKRQAESAAVGGGIKHFGPSHLKQMETPIPPPVEQQRIADCLSALDTRIAAQTAKMESLEQHKRGLMQQLFPAPEMR